MADYSGRARDAWGGWVVGASTMMVVGRGASTGVIVRQRGRAGGARPWDGADGAMGCQVGGARGRQARPRRVAGALDLSCMAHAGHVQQGLQKPFGAFGAQPIADSSSKSPSPPPKPKMVTKVEIP